MSSKKEYLHQVFEKNEFRHLSNSVPKIKESEFRKSIYAPEVQNIYSLLGGIETSFPWKDPTWDLEFENLVIKLDEEINFNRYRGATLGSLFYDNIKSFNIETYKRFCRQFEQECLKSARSTKMWEDRESALNFGPSQEPGELTLKGSSKWKQRAFIDFLEDVLAAYLQIKMIRISIYENIMINNKLIKLDTLLISRSELNEKYLWGYLQRRIK